MATLSGIAFFSHQLGSFVGAYGGGLIYSAMGSYEWAWKGAVAIGIAAGLFQMTMNVRPSARILAERSGAPAQRHRGRVRGPPEPQRQATAPDKPAAGSPGWHTRRLRPADLGGDDRDAANADLSRHLRRPDQHDDDHPADLQP